MPEDKKPYCIVDTLEDINAAFTKIRKLIEENPKAEFVNALNAILPEQYRVKFPIVNDKTPKESSKE